MQSSKKKIPCKFPAVIEGGKRRSHEEEGGFGRPLMIHSAKIVKIPKNPFKKYSQNWEFAR
jgi:hypothetical protein